VVVPLFGDVEDGTPVPAVRSPVEELGPI
jgi:hypothetical protein